MAGMEFFTMGHYVYLSVGLWHKAAISLVKDDSHGPVLAFLFWKIASNEEMGQKKISPLTTIKNKKTYLYIILYILFPKNAFTLNPHFKNQYAQKLVHLSGPLPAERWRISHNFITFPN